MTTWPKIIEAIREKLGGCSASELAKVLEVSIPTMTSWIKGVDPKGNSSSPTFIYAAILERMHAMGEDQLAEAFSRALDRKPMSTFRPGASANRSLTYEELKAKEPSCIQVLLEGIYK